jgi:serine/threonine-protein kinase
MSPERVRDPAVADPRADIYAVGAVAYHLLTAKRLFDAPNELELQRMVLETQAPRASAGASQPIPRALDDLIARCLAKDPAARPQRVDELIGAFDALLREHPWTQDRARRWWQDYNAAQESAAV